MRINSEPEVDFLIIGAAKCATTWLQMALSRSPAIFMPGPELHFFSRHYDRGLAWYRSQFPVREGDRIFGEKSNSYLTSAAAAERIRLHLPHVRMIIQMRNPVARAYSDYCMLYRRGEVSSDIERHLDPDRAGDGRFLDFGLYARHLQRFHDLFGADAILPLLYEDVVADPDSNLAVIAEHIGLKVPPPPPEPGHVKDRNAATVPLPLRRLLRPVRPLLDPVRHTLPVRALRHRVARRTTYPELPADLEKNMWDFYRDDMLRLKKMIGSDLAAWHSPPPSGQDSPQKNKNTLPLNRDSR